MVQANVKEQCGLPALGMQSVGPPARSPGHIIRGQAPPGEHPPIAKAGCEDPFAVWGECEPRPSGWIVDTSPHRPAPQVHNYRLFRALATRDRHELTAGRDRDSPAETRR